MNIISPLIQFQQQLRIFHWQTDSYAEHKAFGKTYESLDGLIDDFVETFMGVFGRSKPTTTFQIILKPLSDMNVVNIIISDFINCLDDLSSDLENHTDLLNLRDSLRGEVNKLKYLLSLK
jgi:hypothetical protein